LYQAGALPTRLLLRSPRVGGSAAFGFDQSDFVSTPGTVPQYTYFIPGFPRFTDVIVLAPYQQLYGASLGGDARWSMAAAEAVKLDDIGKMGRVTDASSRTRQILLRPGQQPLAIAVAPPDAVLRVTVRVPDGPLPSPANNGELLLSNDFNALTTDPGNAYRIPRLAAVDGGSQHDTFILAPGEKLYAILTTEPAFVSVFKTLFSDVFSPVDFASPAAHKVVAKFWNYML
jgi:hypothetical protein